MKLNIANNNAFQMNDAFGIPETRADQLMSSIEKAFVENEPLQDEAIQVHSIYAQIAEDCNTLEEFAMCMHIAAFSLARTGTLNTEL